jgi:hypothetical protein
VLLTQRSACAEGAMEKLEAYVRRGGKAIVTTGFFRAMYDRGIREMTSVRLTNRHAMGKKFMIDRCDYDYAGIRYAEGKEKVLLEVLDYKTNATWADILMLSREDNFPLLTEDFYGKGRLLILNVPENFADLYQLPGEVIETICAEISRGQSCYLAAEPKWSLITYDNEAVCVHSFRPMPSQAGLVVRGSCRGIRNLSTGEIITDCVRKNAPRHRGDAAMTRSAEDEFEFTVRAGAGQSVYLKILR